MLALLVGVAMCQMDLIAGNDDGIPPYLGSADFADSGGTITNHLVPTRNVEIAAVDYWLRVTPHAVTGVFPDFRSSMEWQKLDGNGNPIWYTPQRVLTTIGPNNDPAGPMGESDAIGVSATPYHQDGNGDWVVGWVDDSAPEAQGRWYRFVFDPPIVIAPQPGRALHVVGRKWPREAGAPKQGKCTWPHAIQEGREIIPQGDPPCATLHGKTGIIYAKNKDLDWQRPDNPHSFCGKMRIWGVIGE